MLPHITLASKYLPCMTNEEKAFHAAVRDLGCIVCRQVGAQTPCEIHHILQGGRRKGKKFVLGLCALHHRGGANGDQYTSRHPWRKAFEARYGLEMSLLTKSRELIGED